VNTITANELKTKGVSSIIKQLDVESEAIITVRGKSQYVVMDIDHYYYLRECELEAALLEAQTDMKDGNVIMESIADHIARITDAL